MEKYYKISETELREFLHDSLLFTALQSGGVDNWNWYGDSINDFIQENGNNGDTLYDIVDRDILTDYEEIV